MSNIVSHGKRMVPEDLVKRLKRGEFTIKLNDIEDVTSLTDKQINSLKAGDVIVKKTGDQTHTYIVTYKEENQGICLSYFDATVIETVSYDYTDGHWVYNSTDIGRVGGVEYTAGEGISINDGVISNDNPNRQLYMHIFADHTVSSYSEYSFMFITDSATPMDLNAVKKYLKDREFYGQSWNNKYYPANGGKETYDQTSQTYNLTTYNSIFVNYSTNKLYLYGILNNSVSESLELDSITIDSVIPLYSE